jgi:hypothetical protein
MENGPIEIVDLSNLKIVMKMISPNIGWIDTGKCNLEKGWIDRLMNVNDHFFLSIEKECGHL